MEWLKSFIYKAYGVLAKTRKSLHKIRKTQERIDLYQYQSIDKLPIRAIAKEMNRSASTISRELRRNRIDETHYLPDTAQMKMQARRQQSKQKFMSLSLSMIEEIKKRLKVQK